MNIRSVCVPILLGLLSCNGTNALADTSPYSTNMYGMLGLNTVPNARMDPAGTVRAQISTLDPYWHASLGFQIADPLYINLRQSAEISDVFEDPKRLYPGVDVKLRLFEESAQIPEIAIGLQSATGHKRTAGEYIAASKRYKSFDFTGGIGWGRFATGAKLGNPLGAISSHFNDDRDLDGQIPNRPSDWFTGEHIGFFGGVEYFTPLSGLSIKADIGGDRYEAEHAAFNYDTPAPWSIGLNYKPADFADVSIAMQGTEYVMARLSLHCMVQNWRDQSAQQKSPTLRPYRTGITMPASMKSGADKDHIALADITTNTKTAAATLKLTDNHSTPQQMKRAITHMSNHAGPFIEEITIAPTSYGLRGPAISFMRKDLENALAQNAGSAEEIWHNTEIAYDFEGLQKVQPRERKRADFKNINLILENQISLSEEDEGVLHRTAIIAQDHNIPLSKYFTAGLGLRLNINDNLDDLDQFRPQYFLPVRADVDDFANRFVALDTAFLGLTHTILPDLHLAAASGYLEEMYAGAGGEILYRPFDKRFALGAESWLALKRDPDSTLNYRLNGDHLLTGHLKAWYDIPEADLTLGIKAGRYLAEDWGGTLSLQKHFKNGAKLEGYVTLTDRSDFDIFGGATHADHGIRLSLPLGGFKYMPPSSEVRVIAKPLGRNVGQSLESPLPLYALTEPLSKAHLIRHWDEITD